MCGIVGYFGGDQALPKLLTGLRNLEYRGYDSAGVAALDDGGALHVEKAVGRLRNLEARLEGFPATHIGIGHTRWATHGEPSERNAHPHTDGAGRIAVVHNGIIENFAALRAELEAEGHRFKSQTDTEVIPHLIEEALRSDPDDFEAALRAALSRAQGAYALGIVWSQTPDRLYAARRGSPLVAGLNRDTDARLIASDVTAMLGEATEAIYLEDGDIAVLDASGCRVIDARGHAADRPPVKIEMESEAIDLGGFETHMLKEIFEQPRVIRGLIERHLNAADAVDLPELEALTKTLDACKRVVMVSCGTAYYAGMFGRLILEALTDLAVETELGSEFRYRKPRLEPGTLALAISQSGETADTLASLEYAREQGCPVLSICNVSGSSLTRISDAVLYTRAGPEIGVASTKAFTAQLTMLTMLALYLAERRGNARSASTLISALRRIPDAIHYLLERRDAIRTIAEKHHDGPSALYLGRRFNYPIALEGALKNKEISYQHAEGYAAGEMKHGPIALINEYMPVICICTPTEDDVYEKMISNMKEVEARHGRIIAVVADDDIQAASLAEDVIRVPRAPEMLAPLINVVALQLLAYDAARARGTDIDKPRNLAKSVTVE